MFDKLDKRNKKKFIYYSFFYIPAILIIVFISGFYILKIIKIEINLGTILAGTLPVLIMTVYFIIALYSQLRRKDINSKNG